MEEMTISTQLVVGIIVFGLFLVLANPAVLEAARANGTLGTTVVVVNSGVNAAQAVSSGEDFAYTMMPYATIKLSNALAEDVTIVPVVKFKEITMKLTEIPIKKGEQDGSLQAGNIRLVSSIPPIQETDGYVEDWIEGQEFFMKVDDAHFKTRLYTIQKSPIAGCQAIIGIECKDITKRITLKQCESDEGDRYCTDNLDLCNVNFVITQRGEVNCDERKVLETEFVAMAQEGKVSVAWNDFGEKMKMGFFRKTPCIIAAETLEEMIVCANANKDIPTVVDVNFKIEGISA